MGNYVIRQQNQLSRTIASDNRKSSQLTEIVDTSKHPAEGQMKIIQGSFKSVQFVKKEMYSGDKKRKFGLVEQMLLDARGGYSREDVTRILEGVSEGNMEIILGWADVHITSMPWNISALDILNKPSDFPVKYGKGKVRKEVEIAEEQWGETALSGTLKTTIFTSCIGVAAKFADKIRVLHLVLVGGGTDEVVTDKANKSDVLALIRQVTSGAERKAIFGCLECWSKEFLKELGLVGYERIGSGEGRWEIAWDKTTNQWSAAAM